MDQRRRTHIEKNSLSCVFDTRFTFDFKNKTKEDINAANIQFDVRNYNFITSYRLIGSYVDDLSNIYNKKDKEDSKLYRRWVCLMDSEDDKDSGVQGYLKVSVEIVCPGKTLPIHDVDKEIKEEFYSNDMTLAKPRNMPFREWKYLVVKVYKCEHLPVMKSKVPGSVLIGKDILSEGTTAFCQLLHGSSKALKSKPLPCKVDESNPSTCHREFGCQLWYPIWASSEVITFSVWSKSRIGSNNLIANVVESISNIESNPMELQLKWYNFYGCPETSKEQSLVGSVGKAIKGTLTSATSKLLHSTDHRKRYNDFPSIAPAWKGRALLSFSVKSEKDVTEPPNNLYYAHKPFPVDSLSDNVTDETIDLCLKVQIFMASQIKIQKGKKYKFKVSIGEFEKSGNEADTYGNQLCKWKWDEEITINESLPCFNKDLRQIPDVFIYLLEDDTPIFFKRIAPYKEVKSKEVMLLGFDDKPQWVRLNVNKAAYQLEEGYGHGKLLVRIGLDKDDSNIKNWYKDDSNNSKSTNNKKSLLPPPTLYDVRICIYQAEYLKQVDYNNDKADPYVKVSFNGREKKTSVFRESVHPAWYECIVFDRVPLSEEENFIYNDLITCSLYDHNDYTSHRYLGSVTLSLDKDLPLDKERQTVVSDPSESPIPEEGDWHDIKRGEGRILIKVVLVKHTNSTQDPPSIVPYTKSAVIKIFALGLRDLPSTTINPFLEVKLQSFTSPNPKFVNRIRSSEDKAFDAKRVYDIEDGRNSNRIPDDSDDISAKKTYTLEVLKVKTSKSKKPKPTNPNYLSEHIICAQLPEEQIFARPLVLEVRDAVGVKGRDISTGTGIVGRGVVDLKKRFPWVECNKSASYESDLSYEDPPLLYKNQEWAVGRKFLKGSVENSIKRSDFESFDIERLSFGVFKKSVQVVGKFKGFVRVFENSASGPIMGKDVQRSVKKENAKYTVRLYILDAINLQAMDYDWINMQPKSSDPYLKVKLGNSLVLNDSKNYVSSATEVDFHKVIEFDCQLPGIANVLIEVWDKDHFKDDLIGQTVIDLEDRFFNENWDALGKEEGKKAGKLWDRKPVERRELYRNQSSQGQLRCWLDIMKIEEASSIPPDDIAIPPNQEFEVRVVIWGTKDVRSQDTLGGIGIGSDLYVKCWPEGCKPQSTDTHWRCQDGKASFNYRILFDVELGHRTRAMKFPNLYLQLWDRDVFKYNDCIGQTSIDLSEVYRKAYEYNVAASYKPTKKSNKKQSKHTCLGGCLGGHKKEENVALKTSSDKQSSEKKEESLDVKMSNGKQSNEEGMKIAVKTIEKHSSDDETVELGRNPIFKPKFAINISDDQLPTTNESDTSKVKTQSTPSAKKKATDIDELSDLEKWFESLYEYSGDDSDVLEVNDVYKEFKKSRLYNETKQNEPSLEPFQLTCCLTNVCNCASSICYRMTKCSLCSSKNKAKRNCCIKSCVKNTKGNNQQEDTISLSEHSPYYNIGNTEFSNLLKSMFQKMDKSDDYQSKLEYYILYTDYLVGYKTIIYDIAEVNDSDEALVEKLRKFTEGFDFWNVSPPNSHSCDIIKINHNSKDKNHTSTNMGKIIFSVEVWPKHKANSMKVGSGRSEPNTNPYLPPPSNRMNWRIFRNPCRLIYRLVGLKIGLLCLCFSIIIIIVVLMMMCQPFFDFIVNIVSLKKLYNYGNSYVQ